MRLIALLLTILTWAGDAMSRPFFLYENALETATLTASSTEAGYSVDSVKTRIPSDRWRSVSDDSHTITAELASEMTPTAFAITGHSGLLSVSPQSVGDGFNRADEAALGAPWTKQGDGELAIVSNVATRAGQPNGVVTFYTHDTEAIDTDGYGWVQTFVRFNHVSAAAGFHSAGVMMRWGAGPDYLAAVLRPTGAVHLEKYGAFIATGSVGGALTDDQWYKIRLEVNADGAIVYINDIARITSASIGGVASTRVVGLVVEHDDPALCSTDFEGFGAGILSPDGDRGIVILRGGDDGSTWDYERVFVIDTEGTIAAPFDDAGSHVWWQFQFPLDEARAITIGCLALGRRLNLTESMAQGFDPFAVKIVAHQARSNSGSYLGHVVRYPSQTVKLRFGPAGLSTTDFFNVTGTPSWRDFMRSTWARGRAFWFAWDYAQQPQDAWFCMVPANASTGAPFITAIRRGWTFDFDTLVEALPP